MEAADAKDDNKRKRDINSTGSISEVEKSPLAEITPDAKTTKSRQTKKAKQIDQDPIIYKDNAKELSEMRSQIKDLKSTVSNLTSKTDRLSKKTEEQLKEATQFDENRIKNMLKSMIDDMKVDVMASLGKQIEVLEGQLFEKQTENDSMRTKIHTLETKLSNQADENERLARQVERYDAERRKAENDLEQYSRSNNIIVGGLTEKPNTTEHGLPFETAPDTAKVVVDSFNHLLALDLSPEEIDIAHRLKRGKVGEKDIIIKFTSRLTKNEIMSKRKMLRNAGVFLRDDLTPLNNQVFMSVKKKMPDEVKSVWWQNGGIFYRDRMDRKVRVTWEDYDHWLDLPWPTSQRNY